MERRIKCPVETVKRAVITVIILLFLLAACDNQVNTDPDSTTDSNTYVPYTITYSAGGHDVSRLIEWEWAKAGTDFTYLFQTDGTISATHCCGEVFDNQFSYLFLGSVLVTYGSEMDVDKIEVAGFTITDDDLSFTLSNETNFIRGEARDKSSSGSALVLSNVLLGTWNGNDGNEYIFGSDASLKIGLDQYGYLVRNAELFTLGPIVDGTQAVLQKYIFTRTGNILSLKKAADGKTYILNFSHAE